MGTPDVSDQYAQINALAAANPLQMMYMQAGMDPTTAAQFAPMMMQDPATAAQYAPMMMQDGSMGQFSPMMIPHMQQQQMQMAFQAAHAQMASPIMPSAAGDATGYNSKGLPIRKGVQGCQFFLKTGECKFGPACKWDHSETHDAWNNPPIPALPGGLIPPIPTNPTAASEGTHNSLGYPLRPSQQPCSYFSKTGTCSYGGTCKWDHPEEFCALAANNPGGPPPIPTLVDKGPPLGFNSLGYPIRPSQQPCTFYLKTGTCSFGLNCRWDHPEGMGGSQPGFKKVSVMPSIVPVGARVGPY